MYLSTRRPRMKAEQHLVTPRVLSMRRWISRIHHSLFGLAVSRCSCVLIHTSSHLLYFWLTTFRDFRLHTYKCDNRNVFLKKEPSWRKTKDHGWERGWWNSWSPCDLRLMESFSGLCKGSIHIHNGCETITTTYVVVLVKPILIVRHEAQVHFSPEKIIQHTHVPLWVVFSDVL